MKLRRLAARALLHSRGLDVIKWQQVKNRLTVLAYHRIIDYTHPDFDYYLPNVSASPQQFAEQIAFVAENFNVVSLDDVRAAAEGSAPLPDYPLLITFDDGYLDNYENAYPVLKKFKFPAAVFLTTSRMDDPQPLWWDIVSRLFALTKFKTPDLPLVGTHDITSPVKNQWVLDALIAKIKVLPELEKCDIVHQVCRILDPDRTIIHNRLPRTFMVWDEVRDLIANGIACQPHTHNHPILTRINLEMAKTEIECSKEAIFQNTGHECYAFAYPNGTPVDYNNQIMSILKSMNFNLGFTLKSGAMLQNELKREPFEIKRHYIGVRDTKEVFAARLVGALGV